MIKDAVGISGELDTTKLVKGLLQLRNTPDPDTGLCPAEMLLGSQSREFIPAKPAKIWQKYGNQLLTGGS